MTLTIELTGEMEQRLCEAAAAGGQDLSTCVQQILAEHLVVPPSAPTRTRRSKVAFRERLQQWIDLHPPGTHFVDDSRESIYAGCGE